VPETSRQRLTDPKKIEALIIENLKSSWTYRKTEKIKNLDPFLESGFLHKNFLLSEIRQWLGYLKGEQQIDNIILHTLDTLAETGRIKIFSMGQDRFMSRDNIKFCSEVGIAQKSYKEKIRYVSQRFYANEPLLPKEFDEFCLQDISGRVQKIRSVQQEFLAKKYGKSGLEIESLLHRQDIADDISFKRELISGMNKKRKKTMNKKRKKK